jgi:hypothetical protein
MEPQVLAMGRGVFLVMNVRYLANSGDIASGKDFFSLLNVCQSNC